MNLSHCPSPFMAVPYWCIDALRSKLREMCSLPNSDFVQRLNPYAEKMQQY
jgi:hypothetical protein